LVVTDIGICAIQDIKAAQIGSAGRRAAGGARELSTLVGINPASVESAALSERSQGENGTEREKKKN